MEFLLEHCEILIDEHGGVLLSLFLAGLTGGLSHCVGMCAPFVMAQVTSNMAHVTAVKMNSLTRLKGAALIPYHMGRMTTYAMLGAMSAAFTMTIVSYAIFKWIAIVLLSVSICMFVASICPKMKINFFKPRIFSLIHTNSMVKTLMKNPTMWRGYALGVSLGFLPCGLVYAAIMIVASTGNVVLALVGMVLFSLGTIPGLLLVGLGASFAPNFRQGVLKHLVPMLLIINSIILLYTIRELF